MEKVHQMVWESLIDYGKTEWHKILQELTKAPYVYNDTLAYFDFV